MTWSRMHGFIIMTAHGVEDDAPMLNEDAEASITPFTITSTCVAVAVMLLFAQAQHEADLTTKRNSRVRVCVRPGALPRVGGSVIVMVRFPPPGQGTVRRSQGPKVGLPGDPTVIISVHVFAGCVAWAGILTFSHHSHVQSQVPALPAENDIWMTNSNAWPLYRVSPVLGETKPVAPKNCLTLPIVAPVTQQLHLGQVVVADGGDVAPLPLLGGSDFEHPGIESPHCLL